jgi:hypothetical protein
LTTHRLHVHELPLGHDVSAPLGVFCLDAQDPGGATARGGGYRPGGAGTQLTADRRSRLSLFTITEMDATVPQQAGSGGFGPIRRQNVYTNTQQPLLPYRLASFVTAILGLTDYGPYVSDTAKPSSYDEPQTSSSNTCIAEFGLSDSCHLSSYFSQAYNLNPLYARTNGAGETVGIVTLAAVDPGSPQYFWTNIAHVNRTGSLIVDNVDGGPGAPSADSGSVETDLDIEQSGALAPGANVIPAAFACLVGCRVRNT